MTCNNVLRNAYGSVMGGVRGSTSWDWLHITLLVVKPDVRGRGYGSKLLAAIEERAFNEECQYAYTDTFSFQSLPFYQKQGYVIFGTLEDYPPGHCCYFLKKTLKRSPLR